MGLNSEVDISRAHDTAETREAGGDPVICKPKITLQDGKGKYGGSKKKAVQALAAATRIGDCMQGRTRAQPEGLRW